MARIITKFKPRGVSSTCSDSWSPRYCRLLDPTAFGYNEHCVLTFENPYVLSFVVHQCTKRPVQLADRCQGSRCSSGCTWFGFRLIKAWRGKKKEKRWQEYNLIIKNLFFLSLKVWVGVCVSLSLSVKFLVKQVLGHRAEDHICLMAAIQGQDRWGWEPLINHRRPAGLWGLGGDCRSFTTWQFCFCC